MRYENQNPQYIYLLEKIEEQERKIQEMNADVLEAHEMCEECIKLAEYFNSLPWYKKVFFKFKL